jgi:hypothetical protein
MKVDMTSRADCAASSVVGGLHLEGHMKENTYAILPGDIEALVAGLSSCDDGRCEHANVCWG